MHAPVSKAPEVNISPAPCLPVKSLSQPTSEGMRHAGTLSSCCRPFRPLQLSIGVLGATVIMPKKTVSANTAPLLVIHRSFKTSWFAKAARKRGISDDDLCEALAEVMLGQADDLGGGVWKKRLNKNMDRSIVVAKGGRYWIFVFLFQKSARENIDDRETSGFRLLASQYARLTETQLEVLVKSQDLMEICIDENG